jgi:hypothetical protein
MFGKIQTWVLGILVNKYALGWLVKGYRQAAGYRTGLAIAAAVIVFVAQVFGYIPAESADGLYKILGAFGATAFIEKLKRYQKAAEKVAEAVKEKAAEVPAPNSAAASSAEGK